MPQTPPRIVALTGATGFIGVTLVRALVERGDEVRILSRRLRDSSGIFHGVKWFQGDLRHPVDPAFLEGVDTLFHLAAELRDPERMQEVNVLGTEHLLEAADDRVRRWIQLSSVGVYGPPSGRVVDEKTPPVPGNEYERTKLASDRLVEAASRISGMEFAILRPSNVVGVGMQNGSVFALIDAVRRGRFVHIGPRGSIATYVHVDDVVRALLACRDAPTGRVYNISSDCAWEQLIDRIAQLVEVRPPRLRLPAWPLRLLVRALEGRMQLPITGGRLAALTNRTHYPSDRIVRELGFTFVRPMPDSIADLVGVRP
ncbi:MAG: NAD-dependent epimerase/dehydratase family protein [Planctomycetes bacterium]|nr:NAD-dependent epimerase/dehydratase family protein [Planctomycetota bacterium]